MAFPCGRVNQLLGPCWLGEGQGGPLMTEQTDGGGEVWGSSTAVRTVPPPAGAGARVVQTGGLVTGPVAAPRTRQAVGPASHTAAVQPCLPGPAPAFSSGIGQRLPGSWVGEQLSGHGDIGASADSLGSPPPRLVKGWLPSARCRRRQRKVFPRPGSLAAVATTTNAEYTDCTC